MEDLYIVYALEYENKSDYINAIYIYDKLFNRTNNYEYFLKKISLLYSMKKYNDVDKFISNKTFFDIKDIKQEKSILEVYILSLIELGKYKKASGINKYFSSRFNSIFSDEIVARIEFFNKNYKTSYRYFYKAYENTSSLHYLLNALNIQYYYLNEKEKAKKMLKEYLELNNYDFVALVQLLTYYEKDNEDDKIYDLLLNIQKYGNNIDSSHKEIIRNLFVRYLSLKNLEKAISFLENNKIHNELLVELYRKNNKKEKAYKLLKTFYKQSLNKDYLVQIAILEFEMAEDKNVVLESVIKKFEDSLKHIDNHIYDNYFAYLLIDYDKDIKKGIVLVNKALDKKPNNISYLDTLAWGEYKMGNCKKAYEIMKKIVDKIGLKDSEIKIHWEKIQECR